MESQTKNLQKRLENLKNELGNSQLVAVSKQANIELIKQCYELGQRDFGENRVEQLFERAELFYQLGYQDIRWHFIGHLQSNKLKKLLEVRSLFAIHSIDSLKLAQKICQDDRPGLAKIKLFLQVKTSFEAEKFGFKDIKEIEEALAAFDQTQFAQVEGLMTMAPVRTDELEKMALESFSTLQKIQKELNSKRQKTLELSMGMSGDFRIALKYGSDWVRLGRTLFDEAI